MDNRLNILFDERICPECGKKFIKAPEHIYKRKLNKKSKLEYYCSYTCYLKPLKREGKL